VIEETYVTERGRSRRRPVVVNLDEVRRGLAPPSGSDRRDWKQISELLAVRVGESTFAIWLSQVELIAVDGTGVLLLIAPAATREWVRSRFGRLITDCTRHVGREWRFATATERAALGNGRAGSAALTERIETKDEGVS